MSIKYLKQRSYVRQLPVTQCMVLANFEYGKMVDATGETVDKYSKIKYGTGFGWVHTESLSDIPMRTHDILKKDGYPAENMLVLADACLSRLPLSIIEYMKSFGWSVLITDKDLDDHFYNGAYGGVGGVTDYANRDIYLQHVKWDIENCLFHEVGHVLDYLMGFVSDSPEFVSIFEAEKHSFKDSTSVGDGHEISCVREYFASVFSEFMLNQASCEASAPKSYIFIANFVKKFSEKT